MKVSFNTASMSQSGKRFVPPPIPLERTEIKSLKKNEYITLKLRSDPTNNDSQTYELTVKFFSIGTPEEWLIFQRDLERILIGQNITVAENKYAMVRRLLEGDALAVFNKKASELQDETDANFTAVLQAVTTHVFPQRALAYQKRYMRRYMRKPRTMTTREFAARITELNGYLSKFPPFGQGQELAQEEINDILEFGVPNSWQKNMVLQGFDPLSHTTSELVAFCERHEFTEGTLDNTEDKQVKPKTSLKSSSNDGKSRAKSSAEAPQKSNKRKHTEKWCDLHQTHGHDTQECKVVQAQIQKMRQSWEPVRNKDKTGSFVKTGKDKDKKELMSMVKEGIKSILKSKKQKKENAFNTESKNEESDFDLEDFNNLDVSDSDSDN
jgi:hypothetical protein